MRNVASAVFWFGVFLALVLAPLLVLAFEDVPPGTEFWWDFSMALGFAGMAMMAVLFFLTARFKHASAPFGIDIIYYFHRYLAILAFLLIFLHFIILRVEYVAALGVIDPRQAPWYMSAGRLAFGLFALLIITSLWRNKLRIHYDEWRMAHIALAVAAFLLALGHIEGEGYYINAPAKRWLWTGYTLFWLSLVLYVRLVKPWQMRVRPYRVSDLRPERGNAWTLALEPDGHRGIRFKPGQFA